MKFPWNRFRTARILAIVLFIIGLQLQVVDTFVFNESISMRLVDRYGAEADTPRGAMQRVAVESGSRRIEWTPAPWIGWSLLSAGIVVLTYGVLGNRWR